MPPRVSLLALALALAVSTGAPAQAAPGAPTGPFQVGTVRLRAVDSSRAELSAASPSEPRRLIVQVWYPAHPTGQERRAPYVLELDQVAADLAEAVPEVALATIRTSAWIEAPPLAGHFPLVVFSHGMNSARYFYTSLLQDLASHGFVVAAIDHPFWALTTAFDREHGIGLAASMASRDQLTSDQIDGYMEDGVALMAEDQAFVAERLAALAPRLRHTLEGMPIGVMGHSMGGMAATLACSRFRVFAACASLDGLVWAREGSPRSASRRAQWPNRSCCSPLRSSCRPISQSRSGAIGGHGRPPSSAWSPAGGTTAPATCRGCAAARAGRPRRSGRRGPSGGR